jgi:hypothetical protein
MAIARVGRTVVAVIASYVTNAILVVATEQLLSSHAPSGATAPQLNYFVVNLISQCLYTVVAGYLCCVIARPSQRVALAGLIGLGLSVGTVSLVTPWKSEPHWYGIALLAVYAPCVWIGWSLRGRANAQSSSDR